jgi:hypothetical protein
VKKTRVLLCHISKQSTNPTSKNLQKPAVAVNVYPPANLPVKLPAPLQTKNVREILSSFLTA